MDPVALGGTSAEFGATGNRLAASGRASRRGRRISGSLAGAAILLVGLGASGAGCGPEMFHQGVEDATGGVGGDDGLGGAAGACPQGGGGVSGDASVPAFTQSFTFDTAAGLIGWAPVGQPPDTVMATTVAFDDQDGFPCAGSARLTIPFAAANSQVAYGYNFSTGPQNFSGKVLTARVRLNSTNGSGTIMAGLAYKSISGVYLFASSAVPAILPAQGWVTFSLSFDHPDGYVDTTRTNADGATIVPDPTQVLEVDVLILTGTPPFMTVDASIDTVGISDP
jgi:hypothetical protein